MMMACYKPLLAPASTVHASASGARLDSDLLKGGGTDDTVALQKILDLAKRGTPLHLVIDGPALVRGLNIYRNTTIECTAGGGLFLKDNSSRAILRNANRSREIIVDEHIEVRGCFLNGNRQNQPSADISRPDLPGVTLTSNKEKDGTFLSGLQFLGVNYLKISDVTLWNVRAFGALIANASYVDIRNVTIDHGGGANTSPESFLQTDGLHFKGPLQYILIDSIRLRVGDDAIAFNANDFETDDITVRNDFGPYVGQGPITDVSVNNVQLMDSIYGFRVLSTTERVDRVVIRNVVGTVKKSYLMNIGHWMNPASFGNVGRITLEHINVDRPATELVSAEATASARKNRVAYGEANGGNTPLININSRIEALQINNLITQVADGRPLLRIGPDAKVGTMDVELTAIDPSLVGNVLQLDEGAGIAQLRFSLRWQGAVADQGRKPITSYGGAIRNLQWVNTPPMYVDAGLTAENIVAVTFSQEVYARDFKAGVSIRQGGVRVGISDVAHHAGQQDVVYYRLDGAANANGTLTWAYEAGAGEIRNLSGSYLDSVAEKAVRFRD